jgi:hypothetical protein
MVESEIGVTVKSDDMVRLEFTESVDKWALTAEGALELSLALMKHADLVRERELSAAETL